MLKVLGPSRGISPRRRLQRSSSYTLFYCSLVPLAFLCLWLDSLIFRGPIVSWATHYLSYKFLGTDCSWLVDSTQPRPPSANIWTQPRGNWVIPHSWQTGHFSSDSGSARPPHHVNALSAAEAALELSLKRKAFLQHSNIPRIIHQTWRSSDSTLWPQAMKDKLNDLMELISVDGGSGQPEIAWVLWSDEDMDDLIREYEPGLHSIFKTLPYAVERADIFRVVVLKWFGGIYADVDCRILQHPNKWIQSRDLLSWSVEHNNTLIEHTAFVPEDKPYGIPSTAPAGWREILSSHAPKIISPRPEVSAIFGIEADFPPDPDSSYWRAGYSYPIQLTNWAMAMAPSHPMATRILQDITKRIINSSLSLESIDPLDIAGPPALTGSVKAAAQQIDPSLKWDDLSGRNDPIGGRGKIVAGDALILPITGFSPGRGSLHQMGSQGIDHPNARLQHAAVGTWRKFNLVVTTGKLCRTLLGRCKDWKKF